MDIGGLHKNVRQDIFDSCSLYVTLDKGEEDRGLDFKGKARNSQEHEPEQIC